MAIQTFSDLKSAIVNWVADSTITDYLEDIILVAEKRLQRDIRIREIEATFSDTMVNGEVDVPVSGSDSIFTGIKHARLDVAGGHPLEVTEADWIYQRFPNRTSSGRPSFIAIDGDKFIFGQFPDAAYTVKGTVYSRPLVLSDSNPTNQWTGYTPDALLFACLAETAPFLREDERLPIWESRYNQIKEGYNALYKKETRNRTRVMYDPN